jgi:hypothetical protein
MMNDPDAEDAPKPFPPEQSPPTRPDKKFGNSRTIREIAFATVSFVTVPIVAEAQTVAASTRERDRELGELAIS